MLTTLLAFVFRNTLAREIGYRLASYFAQTNVRIERVAIAWGRIEVTKLRIFEPGSLDHVLLDVPETTVRTSLWRGLQTGIWLDSIAVRGAQARLRVDEQGQLLSAFPTAPASEPSGGDMTIPLKSLTLSEASFVVDQAGTRQTLIGDFALQAELGDTIDIRGRIGQLLGGRLQLQSTLDAHTFAGTTKLSIRDVAIRSDQWPFSLAELDSHLNDTLAAQVGVDAEVSHPAGQLDWARFPITVKVVVDQIHSRRWIEDPMAMAVSLTSDGNQLNANIRNRAWGSSGSASIRVDRSATPVRGEAHWQFEDTPIDALLQAMLPEAKLSLSASCSGNAKATMQDDLIDLHINNAAVASRIEIATLPVADIEMNVEIDGIFSTKSLTFTSGICQGDVRTSGIELAHVAKILPADAKLQQTISGRIAGKAQASIPLDRITDAKSLRAEANVAITGVQAMGLIVQDTALRCELVDGRGTAVLPTSEIRASSGKRIGAIASRTEIDDVIAGRVDSQFVTDEIDMETLAATLGFAKAGLGGTMNAGLKATAAIAEIADLGRWNCRSEVRSHDLRVAQEPVDDFVIVAKLDSGRVSIPSTPLVWQANRCTFHADGLVGPPFTVHGVFDANGIRLDDISAVASSFSQQPLPLRGLIDVHGEYTIGGQRSQLIGTAVMREAQYASTDIGGLQMEWSVQPSGLILETTSNEFLGGRYRLVASVKGLDWTQSSVEAEFHDVQAARLAAMGRLPATLQGTLEGGCELTSLANLQQLRGRIHLRGSGLRVNDAPLEISTLTIDIEDSIAQLNLDGGLLRGSVQSTIRADLPQTVEMLDEAIREDRLLKVLPEIPITGTIRLSSLSFESAVAAMKQRQVLRPLAGKFDLTLSRDRSDINENRIASMSATTENIRWDQARMSDRIVASVAVFPDRLQLRSLDGRIAEGRLSGKGQIALQSRMAGQFQVAVERMNLRRLAAPLGSLSSSCAGSASVKINSRINQTITGTAAVAVNHAKLAGIDVRSVRLPVDWSYSLTNQTAHWRCRSGRVDVGNGWIDLSTDGNYRNDATMKFSADVRHVDTSRLMVGSSAGAGILDGRLNLRSKHARSANQLVGDFEFDLSKVEALSLPVLDKLPTLIQLNPGGSSENNVGYVRGRLAGGLVHLDRLTVSQSDVQVTMDGNATLDGRLNFDVTAATGQNSPTEGLTSLVNSPLMLAAPAPAALLIRANEAIKDRVVHVHIGGSANRPTVRIQPGKQLTQDALRFFLSSQFGTSVADAADTARQARTRR